ncbi:ParB/RepB/Spo0J family partition protein [Frigoriglobus tundricola]|uniref:ParB family partition protein n=1 Tax=Frigoriglobus tundricola TaxID=2774151 RepID=A0A6M5Z521_9BACT|nr:ParB/RepB/Spo0J family partition protein [Frigoriglobus tundricola]QJX01339.1 ParB family partition protein [Frigoriglobus tundricola]
MSGASKLFHRVGGKISESIGGGGVQELLTTPAPAQAVTGSMVGRGRNRHAGTIDIAMVVPDPDQPRKEFTEEALNRLAESLKKRGQMQNVRVRWSAELQKWVLISGERRYRAALRAGLKTLNCEFIERELSEVEKLEDMLVENCLREDLNAVELAESYEKLIRLRGCTAKELAASLDVSPSAVTKALGLLKLPEDLRAAVAIGELPRITAYEISRLEGEDSQREMAERVKQEGLTNTQIAEAVQETRGRRNHAASKTGRRLACSLASGSSVTVAGKEELTLDAFIGALGEVLKVAKKAKADGRTLEDLPGMLKSKDKTKESRKAVTENAA